jgi:hypothetical protein
MVRRIVFDCLLASTWVLSSYVIKVNCTLVQALRLCTGRTAHRGSRGIALLFHDHGTRRGWGVSVTPSTFFTPGKDPVPIVQEAGWDTGPVRKFSPPPGFDPWTVQPVASRYVIRPLVKLKMDSIWGILPIIHFRMLSRCDLYFNT